MKKLLCLLIASLLILSACGQKTTLNDINKGFKNADLTVNDKKEMKPEDYSAAPMKAKEALIFEVEKERNARLLEFETSKDLKDTKAYYDDLGKESGALYSHTYSNGSFLLQMNGEVSESKFNAYKKAMKQVIKGDKVTKASVKKTSHNEKNDNSVNDNDTSDSEIKEIIKNDPSISSENEVAIKNDANQQVKDSSESDKETPSEQQNESEKETVVSKEEPFKPNEHGGGHPQLYTNEDLPDDIGEAKQSPTPYDKDHTTTHDESMTQTPDVEPQTSEKETVTKTVETRTPDEVEVNVDTAPGTPSHIGLPDGANESINE